MLNLRASFADKLDCKYSIYLNFEYNPYYIQLIKTMPKYKWNPSTKEWEIPYECYTQLIGTLNGNNIPYNGQSFTKSINDLIKMVESLKQKEKKQITITELDLSYLKTQPYSYQQEGILFGLNHNCFLLADEQGCVNEDTIVSCRINKVTFKLPIKQAYNKFQKHKNNPSISFKIKCLKDGYFGQNEVLDIIKTGIKPTYKILTDSGKYLIATADHEILTPQGYKPLQNLSIDDYVTVNGQKVCYECGSTDRVITVKHSKKQDGAEIIVIPKQDKIIDIQFVGNRTVYDIKMKEPYHNFVANGIVVHNCGKSLQCLGIAGFKKSGNHCLIIAGYDSLQFNWKLEVEKHTNEKAFVLGQKMTKKGNYVPGKISDRLEDLKNLNEIQEYFIITTLTTLRQCEKQEYINKKGKKAYNKTYYIADLIEDWCRKGQIGRIILDEGQTCKNFETDNAQSLLRLKTCLYKIVATGTPIMNKNIDLYPIMVWLNQENRNYYEFRDHYCKMGGFKNKQIIGQKNTPELHERLKSFMLRRKKDEVLDLPEKILINEFLEIDGKQYALYQKMKSLYSRQLIQMRGNKVALLAATLNLRKVTCHPGWVDEAYKDSVKYERARQLVHEAYENGRKTIIFSCFTTPFQSNLDYVNLYNQLKFYNPALIIGDTKDRMEQVDKFQNDPSCYVIIGSIGAMGVGLTLNAASNVIFLDEPWNKALVDQAIDRAHRIGTKFPVNIYTLMCKDTIDEKVHSVVYKKGRMADEIVDGITTEELEQFFKD